MPIGTSRRFVYWRFSRIKGLVSPVDRAPDAEEPCAWPRAGCSFARHPPPCGFFVWGAAIGIYRGGATGDWRRRRGCALPQARARPWLPDVAATTLTCARDGSQSCAGVLAAAAGASFDGHLRGRREVNLVR
jgi:hypothetical protein